MRVFRAIFFVFVFSSLAVAQEAISPVALESSDLSGEFDFEKVTDTEKEKEEGRSLEGGTHSLYVDYRIKHELYPIIILSVAQGLSLLIILFFLTRHNRYAASDIVTISGLAFIIFGTIFLVLVAREEAQLTAAIGILGTTAGYLFGVRQKASLEGKDADKDKGKSL